MTKYKLVPLEPTEKMIQAAGRNDWLQEGDATYESIYKSMLSAAPEVKPLTDEEKDAARFAWILSNAQMGIGQWGKEWDLQVCDQPFPAPNHIGEVRDWIDRAIERLILEGK